MGQVTNAAAAATAGEELQSDGLATSKPHRCDLFSQVCLGLIERVHPLHSGPVCLGEFQHLVAEAGPQCLNDPAVRAVHAVHDAVGTKLARVKRATHIQMLKGGQVEPESRAAAPHYISRTGDRTHAWSASLSSATFWIWRAISVRCPAAEARPSGCPARSAMCGSRS